MPNAVTVETVGETYHQLVADVEDLIPKITEFQHGQKFDHDAVSAHEHDATYPVISVKSGCRDQGGWSRPNSSKIIVTNFGFTTLGTTGNRTRRGFDLLRLRRLHSANGDHSGTALTSSLVAHTPAEFSLAALLAMYQMVPDGPISGWETEGIFPQTEAPSEYREVREIDPNARLSSITPQLGVATSILNQLRTRVVVAELLLEGENPRDVMEQAGWEYPDR